jgi:hypothetical protein
MTTIDPAKVRALLSRWNDGGAEDDVALVGALLDHLYLGCAAPPELTEDMPINHPRVLATYMAALFVNETAESRRKADRGDVHMGLVDTAGMLGFAGTDVSIAWIDAVLDALKWAEAALDRGRTVYRHEPPPALAGCDIEWHTYWATSVTPWAVFEVSAATSPGSTLGIDITYRGLAKSDPRPALPAGWVAVNLTSPTPSDPF